MAQLWNVRGRHKNPINFIQENRGFLYLCVCTWWHSRFVSSWRHFFRFLRWRNVKCIYALNLILLEIWSKTRTFLFFPLYLSIFSVICLSCKRVVTQDNVCAPFSKMLTRIVKCERGEGVKRKEPGVSRNDSGIQISLRNQRSYHVVSISSHHQKNCILHLKKILSKASL